MRFEGSFGVDTAQGAAQPGNLCKKHPHIGHLGLQFPGRASERPAAFAPPRQRQARRRAHLADIALQVGPFDVNPGKIVLERCLQVETQGFGNLFL